MHLSRGHWVDGGTGPESSAGVSSPTQVSSLSSPCLMFQPARLPYFPNVLPWLCTYHFLGQKCLVCLEWASVMFSGCWALFKNPACVPGNFLTNESYLSKTEARNSSPLCRSRYRQVTRAASISCAGMKYQFENEQYKVVGMAWKWRIRLSW